MEENLKEYLSISYNYIDWRDAFVAIEHTEMDVAKVIKVIKELSAKRTNPPSTTCSSLSYPTYITAPTGEAQARDHQASFTAPGQGAGLRGCPLVRRNVEPD